MSRRGMPRITMRCGAMPCHALRCVAAPCHAMPCGTVPYTRYATLRHAMRYGAIHALRHVAPCAIGYATLLHVTPCAISYATLRHALRCHAPSVKARCGATPCHAMRLEMMWCGVVWCGVLPLSRALILTSSCHCREPSYAGCTTHSRDCCMQRE